MLEPHALKCTASLGSSHCQCDDRVSESLVWLVTQQTDNKTLQMYLYTIKHWLSLPSLIVSLNEDIMTNGTPPHH